MRGGDPARFHQVRPGQGLPDGRGGVDERVLVGRVAGKGIEDESKAIWCAVIETSEGNAYYVRLAPAQVESTRIGDLVRFSTKRENPVRGVDRHIAEVSAAHGGVYELTESDGAQGVARGVARRMRELEALGLARVLAPDQWVVASNLLEKIGAGAKCVPRYRLSLELERAILEDQVRRRGPVWLDTVDTERLANSGFGAEVRAAVERRHQAMRELGIAPDDPQRIGKLRDLERRAVGKEHARQSGQRFLEPPPERLRGQIQVVRDDPAYLAVSDGARFVLVPATAEARARERQVATSRGMAPVAPCSSMPLHAPSSSAAS
jgi:hypothetical protein